MQEERLYRIIRDKSILKLGFSIPVLILFILLLYLLIESDMFSSMGFLTPYSVTGLDQIDEITQRLLAPGIDVISVSVKSSDIVDPGIKVTDNGATTGYYLALNIDDKYVMCLVDKTKYDSIAQGKEYTYAGTLENVDDQVQSLVYDDMAEQGISKAEAETMLYRYSLNTKDNGLKSRLMLYTVALFLGVFGVFLAIRGIGPLFDCRNHPQVRKLAAYGPPDIIFQGISRQFDSGSGNWISMPNRAYSVHLLKDWIVIVSPLNVRIVNANDLVWAYKERRTTKLYGVITTAVNYTARLKSKSREDFVPSTESAINGLLAAVRETYPWVIIGYSEELNGLWNKDRGKVIACSESKKTEMD